MDKWHKGIVSVQMDLVPLSKIDSILKHIFSFILPLYTFLMSLHASLVGGTKPNKTETDPTEGNMDTI